MENGRFEAPDFDSIRDESLAPLPPPHSPGQGGREGGDHFDDAEDDDGDTSRLVDVPAAKRKGVKRPQPKLDSQRLTSERGLPALRTLFDNVCFKGKGHEAEDLRLLMQKMENWAHRLYPKLQFEDFMDKVEKLGNKKDVQTCLKRIRLDMPLTHEDFMGGGEEEAAEAPESHVFGDPDPFNSSSFNHLQAPVHSTPAPTAPPAPSPASPSLTEEQRRRMELNRQRALERKLARQQQQTDPSDSQTADSSTSADEPTSVSSANVLNSSKDQDEEVEALDVETANSSTQQQQEEPQEEQEEQEQEEQGQQQEEEEGQQQEEQHEEPSQLPHTDSDPPAESPHSEKEEEEPGLSEVHEPDNKGEDED
ncbi:TIMELESS-interacting protein isoform X2 [Anoplopoma fimbria]|uniref:TIMELESS-interacting protein isoform X2 n=1 Tax=Anoplopoma fimbria TaxID=229290 RepID=UPI0023ECB703|nr:TIMELESS-interacting protein isoform X2 [Anoplopoma fimbria]